MVISQRTVGDADRTGIGVVQSGVIAHTTNISVPIIVNLQSTDLVIQYGSNLANSSILTDGTVNSEQHSNGIVSNFLVTRNQLSKSTLLLGVDRMTRSLSDDQDSPAPDYFPAFEIMMDELRDYRFYAEDMVHPSSQAVDYIADRFLGWALPENEKTVLEERIKKFRQSRHVSSYRNI